MAATSAATTRPFPLVRVRGAAAVGTSVGTSVATVLLVVVVAEVNDVITDEEVVAIAVGLMGTVVLAMDQIGDEELVSSVDNEDEVRTGHSVNVGSH